MTPQARWDEAGLTDLCGAADGPSLPLERDLPARFDQLAAPINAALSAAGAPPVDLTILSDRARRLGLSRQGQASANGSCRLIRAADGWIALNLARPADLDLLPAWLEADVSPADPAALDHHTGLRTVAALRDRAVLLGLPMAVLGEVTRPPVLIHRIAPAVEARKPLRVIDLSSLWAGPLCAALLGRLGAEVIKVESRRRPDGARLGDAGFFQSLNGEKSSLQLDFSDPTDLARLRDLILTADVVVEASRPRALRQLGLDAEALIAARPGLVWASITAYGRAAPHGERVGFGDDAAVAGGLIRPDADGAPLFIGDAIADPLTGLAATSAVVQALTDGGGVLIDAALSGAAAFLAAAPALHDRAAA